MIDRAATLLATGATDYSLADGETKEICSAYSWSRGADALGLLIEGHQLACEFSRDPWDFAVEISELQRGGLSRNALRLLVCEGYVLHAREIDSPSDTERAFLFDPGFGSLRFTNVSCFILTADGVSFVSCVLDGAKGHESPQINSECYPKMTVEALAPAWDSLRQELRLGDKLVKRFKVRAANQERVLAAFEEEGWPPCIDDPLPRSGDIDPKRRLHETINSLNRSQKHRLIRFTGNGKGEGVGWELI